MQMYNSYMPTVANNIDYSTDKTSQTPAVAVLLHRFLLAIHITSFCIYSTLLQDVSALSISHRQASNL